MKKLYMIMISLVLMIGLGACTPSQDTSELDELTNRIELVENDLELQQDKIDVLEEFYRNVVPSVGLNGQTDYYYNQENYLSLASFDLLTSEKDYLDKTKFPDYIWNIEGEYVDVNELAKLLVEKYLGLTEDVSGFTGTTFTIKLDNDTEFTNEDFMVRVCMMIMELAEYDFYTIDSSQFYIEFVGGASEYMIGRTSLLVSDNYNLHPAIFWSGLLDTQVEGITYDVLLLDDIYDTFIENETFSGYVLDYK